MSQKCPHFAKSVYFGCIDDRLSDSSHAHAKKIGGAFRPAMAGGGAALVGGDRTAALKQIVIAYMVNNITDVYLESHTDCGSYRLSGVTFDSLEDEIDRLYSDLDQAAKLALKALEDAGAAKGAIKVHARVVDPLGTTVPRNTRTKVKVS